MTDLDSTTLDRPEASVADRDLARRHAPIVFFDRAEPFVPTRVGYAILRASGPSPSFDRYLNLRLPDGRQAAAVIEYALWTDWDIQHLYELEHVWSYIDGAGNLLYAEASSHGRYAALVQNGRLSREGERPVAFAQPGKHAMVPTPEAYDLDFFRAMCARAAGPDAGNSGVLVGKPIAGRVAKTRRRDALANAYLHRQAFVPTFRFSQRWDAADAPLEPIDALITSVPARLETILAGLEDERSRRNLWAVLFDLGDTLMIEETEEKDETRTTQRAELFPGVADLLWSLRRDGYLLGLVADTRPGTYRNVLRQHDLLGLFDVFAISEELDCEKPNRRMFIHALEGLGLTADEAGHVAMVGNNLARDVRGANATGMQSIWTRFNERYPDTPADEAERPAFAVRDIAGLERVIRELG